RRKIGRYAYYSKCMLEALKGNASIFSLADKDDTYNPKVVFTDMLININAIPSKVLEYLVGDGILEEQYNKIDTPNVQSRDACKNMRNIRENLKTML
ncbi:MAG: hypothetical protein IKP79_02420, partial [Bacilli bacterium]|nr:hypothetical protein [Bacilli bacterium]